MSILDEIRREVAAETLTGLQDHVQDILRRDPSKRPGRYIAGVYRAVLDVVQDYREREGLE